MYLILFICQYYIRNISVIHSKYISLYFNFYISIIYYILLYIIFCISLYWYPCRGYFNLSQKLATNLNRHLSAHRVYQFWISINRGNALALSVRPSVRVSVYPFSVCFNAILSPSFRLILMKFGTYVLYCWTLYINVNKRVRIDVSYSSHTN